MRRRRLRNLRSSTLPPLSGTDGRRLPTQARSCYRRASLCHPTSCSSRSSATRRGVTSTLAEAARWVKTVGSPVLTSDPIIGASGGRPDSVEATMPFRSSSAIASFSFRPSRTALSFISIKRSSGKSSVVFMIPVYHIPSLPADVHLKRSINTSPFTVSHHHIITPVPRE